MLIVFLHLTPALIEGSRQRFAYKAYGFSDYVVRNGELDQEKVWYHNWPSFVIFTAILEIITKVNPEILIKLSSAFFPMILYLFPIFAFMKNVLKRVEERWVAIWVFYVAQWVGRLYLSPQSIGFFMFALIMALLFKWAPKNENLPRIHIFLLFSIFSVLTMGHLLTSLAILSILFVFLVFKHVKSPNLFLLFVSCTVAWTVLYGTGYFESRISHILPSIFNLPEIFSRNVTETMIGSIEHTIVSQTRVAFSLLIAFFVITGFYLSRKSEESRFIDRKVVLGLVGLILPSLFLVYSGELYMRLYAFGSIPFSYFISRNLRSKKMFAMLVVFLMLIAPVMHIVAHYGNEKYHYIPLSEIEGVNFFYEKTSHGYFVGEHQLGSVHNSYDYYISIRVWRGEWEKLVPFNLKLAGENLPVYVCIGREDKEYASRWYGNPRLFNDVEVKMNNFPFYNRIYTNPDFDLYSYHGE